jgi:curved DNA-binding protein CbpA
MNPYQTLGLDPSCSAAEVKAAYRRLSSEHHPDRGGDSERMAQINTAYETLSDPDRRQRFDETGNLREPPGVDSLAREVLFGAMLRALDQLRDDADLVKAVRNALQSARAEGRSKLSDVKRRQERLEAARSKIEDGGLFAGLFDQRAGDLTRGRQGLESQLAAFDRAIELLEACRWTGDPAQMQVYLFTSGTASTTTGI